MALVFPLETFVTIKAEAPFKEKEGKEMSYRKPRESSVNVSFLELVGEAGFRVMGS